MLSKADITLSYLFCFLFLLEKWVDWITETDRHAYLPFSGSLPRRLQWLGLGWAQPDPGVCGVRGPGIWFITCCFQGTLARTWNQEDEPSFILGTPVRMQVPQAQTSLSCPSLVALPQGFSPSGERHSPLAFRNSGDHVSTALAEALASHQQQSRKIRNVENVTLGRPWKEVWSIVQLKETRASPV